MLVVCVSVCLFLLNTLYLNEQRTCLTFTCTFSNLCSLEILPLPAFHFKSANTLLTFTPSSPHSKYHHSSWIPSSGCDKISSLTFTEHPYLSYDVLKLSACHRYRPMLSHQRNCGSPFDKNTMPNYMISSKNLSKRTRQSYRI